MANEMTKTDQFVRRELERLKLKYSEQGSENEQIKNALKKASKSGPGIGKPEFIIIYSSLDLVVVIEDKLDNSKLICQENDVILLDVGPNSSCEKYAVNGALHYANKILENTYFKNVLAIGITGDEKYHNIQPVYVSDGEIKILEKMDSLTLLGNDNIEAYYKYVIKEMERPELILRNQLLDTAKKINEDIRNYGKVEDGEKSLLVSGLLLACQDEYFSSRNLLSKKSKKDGSIVFESIKTYVESIKIPEKKKKVLLNQFEFIKNRENLNAVNETLNMSFIKHLALIIEKKVYPYMKKDDDVLGMFYSEFIKYSGANTQDLGIVLTPMQITELFADLVDLNSNDVVLDICTGTGGFLVSSMQRMIKLVKEDNSLSAEEKTSKILNIKKEQLYGVELRENLYTIASTNMILRGDGKSNLYNNDYNLVNVEEYEKMNATVGMINPPYAQNKSGKTPELEEMQFILDLADKIQNGGKVIAIVPQSVMTGGNKKKIRNKLKEELFSKHTLEGVVTLNSEVFDPVSAPPVIIVLTVGIPHDFSKRVKFIDYSNDGYIKHKTLGRIATENSKDLKETMLDYWFDKKDGPTENIVKSIVEIEDELLHSFYYYNEELPSDSDFEKKIADYLSFKASELYHGSKLFTNGEHDEI